MTCATPEPLTPTVPSGAPSAVNATVPAVTGLPEALTVAVKVTGLPVVDGDPEVVTAVVVATAATSVVITRLHPPAIEPTSRWRRRR